MTNEPERREGETAEEIALEIAGRCWCRPPLAGQVLDTEWCEAVAADIASTLRMALNDGWQDGLKAHSNAWEAGRRAGLEEAAWVVDEAAHGFSDMTPIWKIAATIRALAKLPTEKGEEHGQQ